MCLRGGELERLWMGNKGERQRLKRGGIKTGWYKEDSEGG